MFRQVDARAASCSGQQRRAGTKGVCVSLGRNPHRLWGEPQNVDPGLTNLADYFWESASELINPNASSPFRRRTYPLESFWCSKSEKGFHLLNSVLFFSPVGFKSNVSLLQICFILSSGLKQMEDGVGFLYPERTWVTLVEHWLVLRIRFGLVCM